MNFSKKKNTALNIIKKRKIKLLLKDLRNNECFECSNNNPEYISLNNGIFLCEKCIDSHLTLPKTISNIIKNNLYRLTLNNIQYLCCGGNQKLIDFINKEYPNLKKLKPMYLYQTYAMDYYRKWLEYLIEGGIKPTKPNIDKAYELINIPLNLKKKKKFKSFNKIKSEESFMKINNNKYPKIKPIVGSKISFRFTRSLDKDFNNLNLTTIGNYNNSMEKDDFFNYSNHKTLASDYKKRFFSTNYNKKFFSDDINNDKNNITDINEITEFTEDDNVNINVDNNYEKIKKRINKKYKFDTNIKVLRNSNISPDYNNFNNNNNLRNTIYSKPIYQSYLNSFHDGKNVLHLNKKQYTINPTEGKQQLFNSIDNLRNYISNKNNNKNIFNLKYNNSNDYQNNGNKLKINNINNNIIINKNLNIFYNNSPQTIFKKKTIGNSFSINDKNQKIKSINNSIDKNAIFQKINISKNNLFYNIKNQYKNEWKRKLIKQNKYENSNIVEKIKVNRQFKNKNIYDINNFNTENTYSKFDNEIVDKINDIQKNQIIKRISRVLKNQKEREEKRKSLEKIKVNQKEIEKLNNINMNNERTNDIRLRNENKNIYDKTPKEKNTNIKDKTPKENDNDKTYKEENQNIKGKTPEGKGQNINDKTPKGIDKSKETKKTNTLKIKELINIPSSKKKNILDLIKTNNLTNQLFSPDSKRLIQNGTDPKRIPKKESNLDSKTSIREMYKRKKYKF